MTSNVIFAIAVFGGAYLLTGLVRRFALQSNMVDVPNARSSHNVVTPRGGGVAIVLVFTVVLLYWGLATDSALNPLIALGGALPVAAIGYLDDRFGMSVSIRMLVHVLASGWFVYWVSPVAPVPSLTFVVWDSWVLDVMAVLWMVALLNFYNFMDGIDGLAGVEGVTVGFGAATLAMLNGDSQSAFLIALLACSVSGFLIWNWPPARIFMGDVGSGFVGFTFAGLAVVTHDNGALVIWSWLILLGLFLVDAIVTLLRRMIRGDRIHEAHRTHAYQRATRRFGSHRPVTIAAAAINLFWLLPFAWVAAANPSWGPVVLILAWSPLVAVAFWLGAGRPDP
ncbi:MraY family glycosyltransferase [Lentisalinibacter salinarum]|uniref:MraY family glycosyltransferase n=1 Tax=Lentisalinibacter salinarum TaxID=2992239 RepID=UPI003870267A